MPDTSDSNGAISFQVASYSRQLRQLLPSGAAFQIEKDGTITKVLTAIANELARVDARAKTLIEEWDPNTTLEMLEDWERILSLPDSCVSVISDAIADRRAAIVSKLTTRGGQSRQFYIDLCAALGLTVTITEFKVCKSGRARSGDRCYGSPWAYAWLVNLPLSAANHWFHAGSTAGESLGGIGNLDVECIIQRAAPAHTFVLFSYA
jgi:uncharacterized protein YmfQ (DUF2313 family)